MLLISFTILFNINLFNSDFQVSTVGQALLCGDEHDVVITGRWAEEIRKGALPLFSS